LLADKFDTEIAQLLTQYPEGHQRAAVMPLLYLAQTEYGYLNDQAVAEVAAILNLDPTEVGKLIRFYTLFHDKPGAHWRIQICTDLPCAMRGAEEFSKHLCQRLGVAPGQTTEDGQFSVEEVMCLAACDRAPMFQIQDRNGVHYHENQTVDSALETLEALRRSDAQA
jgi:NADH-quinone oxidoreductase subunit E